MREAYIDDSEMLHILKMISPGTILREGLDNILRARTGALIVIGDSPEVISIVDGGFFIDKEYSPAYLYELAKMDGAIVISKDLKKILYANTLLIPNPTITTTETGTRHKSAERAAIQTGEVVICISQRRSIITVYKNNRKYILKDTPTILTRANQALQTLEKYKAVLNSNMNNLSILEFEDIVTLDDVAIVIQRTEMAMRIVAEIEKYICELGNEGRLVSMQLEELTLNIEENCRLVIEDYISEENGFSVTRVIDQIRSLNSNELMDVTMICKMLGHYENRDSLNISLSPRGYRIMSKIPRIPLGVIRNMVNSFNNFQGILGATIEELDEVEGIGEARAKSIKQGLRKVQDQLLLDNKYVV